MFTYPLSTLNTVKGKPHFNNKVMKKEILEALDQFKKYWANNEFSKQCNKAKAIKVISLINCFPLN